MGASAESLEELRRLVAAVERSGLAERRPEVAALLAHSRARLAATRPVRRRRGSARARARALLALPLDAIAMFALVTGGAGLAAGTLPAGEALAWLAAALGWGALRIGAWLGAAAAEGLRRAVWWARRALAWTSEPFSDAAFARLEAMDDALDLMRAWRRSAPAAPALPSVIAFLAERHGPVAAQRFESLAEAWLQGGWTLRGGRGVGPGEAGLLRWSALIRLFERLAAEGVLWGPAALPAPTPPPAPPPEPEPPRLPVVGDTPERRQRRLDLREQIRRKRQEIDAAHGWKLKTAAEVAQRDAYLNGLRREIASLEEELAALGPEVQERAPGGPVRLAVRG